MVKMPHFLKTNQYRESLFCKLVKPHLEVKLPYKSVLFKFERELWGYYVGLAFKGSNLPPKYIRA